MLLTDSGFGIIEGGRASDMRFDPFDAHRYLVGFDAPAPRTFNEQQMREQAQRYVESLPRRESPTERALRKEISELRRMLHHR